MIIIIIRNSINLKDKNNESSIIQLSSRIGFKQIERVRYRAGLCKGATIENNILFHMQAFIINIIIEKEAAHVP